MAGAGNINSETWRIRMGFFAAMGLGKRISVILVPALLLLHCGTSEPVCPDDRCDNYASQQDAQKAFDADRDCRRELDADNDGVACEHLPAGGGTSGIGGTGGTGNSGCPTTANCGCSNKNKDACATACCKWIVGTGCRCR